MSETRKATVTVHGRKIQGYPGVSREISFIGIKDLLGKIDKMIGDLDYGKVDVSVEDDGSFTLEEAHALEKEWVLLN
jgi:hypothetical protein